MCETTAAPTTRSRRIRVGAFTGVVSVQIIGNNIAGIRLESTDCPPNLRRAYSDAKSVIELADLAFSLGSPVELVLPKMLQESDPDTKPFMTNDMRVPFAASISDYVARWLCVELLSYIGQFCMGVRVGQICPRCCQRMMYVLGDFQCSNCNTVINWQGMRFCSACEESSDGQCANHAACPTR
jgi:hypothetical protein